jgi:hypothetical protein
MIAAADVLDSAAMPTENQLRDKRREVRRGFHNVNQTRESEVEKGRVKVKQLQFICKYLDMFDQPLKCSFSCLLSQRRNHSG